MSEYEVNTAVEEQNTEIDYSLQNSLKAPAYMNRLFCSTKERVAYVVECGCPVGFFLLG